MAGFCAGFLLGVVAAIGGFTLLGDRELGWPG